MFDIDGTLVDSVDLHALAWHEAFREFDHSVSVEQARSQIRKGGDQLIPTFLSNHDIADHGAALEEWRSARFKSEYLASVRPFSGVLELFRDARNAGLTIAVASSAVDHPPPGCVLLHDDQSLWVATGANEAVEILELQPAGKRRMSAKEFLRGNKLRASDRFGPETP